MNLVFVHLNTPIPVYLKNQLSYCAEKFTEHSVHLIHNENGLNLNIENLNFFEYQRNYDATKIENSLSHPKDFRGNFWFSSIERLIALKLFMVENNQDLIHIESDVLISPDFPFEHFRELHEDIAYPITSELRGVASTVYIRNKVAIDQLAQFALECCLQNPQTSDMLILGEYKSRFPERVAALPFGPNNLTHYHENMPKSFFQELVQNLEILGGVFDGSDLGVYFFGTDPRNRRGITELRKPINFNYAKISNWRIHYSKSREFLELSEGQSSQAIPIYSIHATCKNPNLFLIKNYPKLLIKAVDQSHDAAKSKIVFNIMITQGLKAFRKKFRYFLKMS